MEKNHSFHTWITAHLILLHSPRFEGLCLFDWSTLFISLRYSVYLVEGLCLFHWDTLFIWLKDSVYLIEILCLFHWDTLFIWLLIFVSNRETTDSYTIAASPIFGSLRSNPSFYNTSQKPSFYRQSRSNLDVESKAPFLPIGTKNPTKPQLHNQFGLAEFLCWRVSHRRLWLQLNSNHFQW